MYVADELYLDCPGVAGKIKLGHFTLQFPVEPVIGLIVRGDFRVGFQQLLFSVFGYYQPFFID
ncbi:MAG: hypothetical protein JSU58_07390, partial [Dehalococcoidales bacterium]